MNAQTPFPTDLFPGTIEGTIHTVRFYRPFKGAIFTVLDEEGALHVIDARQIGTIGRMPARGEIWRSDGDWQAHAVYGRQLRARRCELLEPRHGKLLVRYLAEQFDGIGRAKAARLYAHFDQRGEDLVDVLDRRQTDRLREVLSERTDMAGRLVEQWHEKRREIQAVVELERLGFGTRLADVVIKCWGEGALEMVHMNPYFMLAFAGWETVDRIALAMGVGRKDERRLIGAVEAVMYRRLEAKHTLTSHAAMRRGVMDLLGAGCGKAIAERSIRLAGLAKSAVGSEDAGWQTRPVAMMENFLMERIPRMVAGERPDLSDLFDANGDPARDIWGDIVNTCGEVKYEGALLIEEAVQEFQRETGYGVAPEQVKALVMVAENQFGLLLGDPGTGKTCIARMIHGFVERLGGTVHQMALSGRAKERLRKATRREAVTIAKFLHLVADGQIRLTGQDLVLIDEASMVGLSMLYSIVRILPAGCRLLLVGDPGQLPPIDFGMPFHTMTAADDKRIPKARLVEVHRQREATGIPRIARVIRAQTVPEIGAYVGRKEGVSFVDCPPEKVAETMLRICRELGGPGEVQIIGVVKRGDAGTRRINELFHERLTVGRARLAFEDYAVGDPVIWLENNVDIDLYNGMLGTVVSVRDEGGAAGQALVCDFDGAIHEISASEMHMLDLAYAITCHKAQGSSFPRVIIPVVRSRLLDMLLLYTALTRAELQVVFVGDRALFNEAVVRPPRSLERDTGFRA